jgi:hypothetical protein
MKTKNQVTVKKSFKLKIDLQKLRDAIIDGKLCAKEGDKLVTERFRNGKNVIAVCEIRQIGIDGVIQTWDSTVEQWYSFSLHNPPSIVKLLD